MRDYWIMVNIHVNKLSTTPPAVYPSVYFVVCDSNYLCEHIKQSY